LLYGIGILDASDSRYEGERRKGGIWAWSSLLTKLVIVHVGWTRRSDLPRGAILRPGASKHIGWKSETVDDAMDAWDSGKGGPLILASRVMIAMLEICILRKNVRWKRKNVRWEKVVDRQIDVRVFDIR
jgi:hypothetical protein